MYVDSNLDIPFPGESDVDVESKIKNFLKGCIFFRKNEINYIRVDEIEIRLDDLHALVAEYNQILKIENAEHFILTISDDDTKRDKSLNDLFPKWLKIAKTYYKVLTLLRGGRNYNRDWAELDFNYFQTTSQLFLFFAKMSYVKKPVRIFCPERTFMINNKIPRFSRIVKKHHEEFNEIIKCSQNLHITLVSDETIGKKYFEYAYFIFTGVRLCSNTGRFKNIYSRIGESNIEMRAKEKNVLQGQHKVKKKIEKERMTKVRELKKEIRHEDTLVLIKKIFVDGMFDGRFYSTKEAEELLQWKPEKSNRNDISLYLNSITWSRRHNKLSSFGEFFIDYRDEKKIFSVRQQYAHFVLVTPNDPHVNVEFE